MPAPRPRLLASDFDGTLIATDGTLTNRTRDALHAAEDAGIEVLVVTARPPRWMDAFAGAVGAHGHVLCSNGGFVYRTDTQTVVEALPIPAERLALAVERLRRAVPGVVMAVETPMGMRAEPGYTSSVTDNDAAERVEDILDVRADDVVKVLARHHGWDDNEFVEAAAAAVEGVVTCAYSGALGLAEMTDWGVTKASSLARWCERRGFAPAEVWAFGDMPNDLPMLTWAGRGYAVANAHPDVRAAATHRCASNDDDGVAQVIEQLLADGRLAN